MATARARDVLKIPGKLVKDPTDLAAAYPYGGTELGLYRSVVFNPGMSYRPILAEEHAMAAVEVLVGEMAPTVACTLRSYDDDAIAAIFPQQAAGGTSGHKVISWKATGTGRAGTRVSQSSMKLLFVPNAPIRHPAIYIPDAMPAIAEDASVALSSGSEWGVNIVFHCRPDATDRLALAGRIVDLTL